MLFTLSTTSDGRMEPGALEKSQQSADCMGATGDVAPLIVLCVREDTQFFGSLAHWIQCEFCCCLPEDKGLN